MTPQLRIGDRERETAVSALGEHYVAGRLTKDEYDERSAVAWQARTNTDLAPLFWDLPPLHRAGGAPDRSSTRPVPRRGARLPFLPLLLVLVGLAMLTDVWVVLLAAGVLWWAGFFRWMGRVGGAPHHRGCSGHSRR